MAAATPKPPLTADQQRLAADNVRLAYWLAGRFARRHCLDEGDCDGEALLGLVDAARLFDPCHASRFEDGKCVRFSTYATWAVHRRLVRLLEVERRRAERHGASIDAFGSNAPTVPPRLYDDFDAAAVVELAGQDSTIIRLRFLDGLTLQGVADVIGVSKERIRQRIERGLALIRAALGGKRVRGRPRRPGGPARVGG